MKHTHTHKKKKLKLKSQTTKKGGRQIAVLLFILVQKGEEQRDTNTHSVHTHKMGFQM